MSKSQNEKTPATVALSELRDIAEGLERVQQEVQGFGRIESAVIEIGLGVVAGSDSDTIVRCVYEDDDWEIEFRRPG